VKLNRRFLIATLLSVALLAGTGYALWSGFIGNVTGAVSGGEPITLSCDIDGLAAGGFHVCDFALDFENEMDILITDDTISSDPECTWEPGADLTFMCSWNEGAQQVCGEMGQYFTPDTPGTLHVQIQADAKACPTDAVAVQIQGVER